MIQIIPEYVILHLSKYGNVAINRMLLCKYGDQKILEECRKLGFPNVELQVIAPLRNSSEKSHRAKYPKDFTYALVIKQTTNGGFQ